MAEENGTLLCQVCGNVARLTLTVSNPRVSGRYARNVCSRLCGDIKARDGIRELLNTGGVGECDVQMFPILTGKSPGVVVK